MIVINFGKWEHAAGRFWFRERIYWRWGIRQFKIGRFRVYEVLCPVTHKGYRWSPFCRLTRRRYGDVTPIAGGGT